MKIQPILFAILISAMSLLSLAPLAGACISNFTGAYVNCTIDTSNTPFVNVVTTIKTNSPWAFGVLYVGIYISIAFFLLVQDRSFARFNFISLLGVILAIVFRMFNLIGGQIVVISIFIFGLCLVASIFARPS